jgi:hypothetical protein
MKGCIRSKNLPHSESEGTELAQPLHFDYIKYDSLGKDQSINMKKRMKQWKDRKRKHYLSVEWQKLEKDQGMTKKI